MQSTAKDVTTYINEAPAERRETLLKLRDLCQMHLTGFTESMLRATVESTGPVC